MISNPHVVCDPAALRLVHQSSCSDCPAADWTTLLLPTQGVLTFCVSVHACQRQRDEQKKIISSFNLSSGRPGVHQRHQPQADVLAVSGLT